MDAKGRPTRLEDIITAESLMAILKAPALNREEMMGMLTDPSHSLGIMEGMAKIAAAMSDNASINVSLIFNPESVIDGLLKGIIICIDDAIRQRAEVDELNGMTREG